MFRPTEFSDTLRFSPKRGFSPNDTTLAANIHLDDSNEGAKKFLREDSFVDMAPTFLYNNIY